MWVVFHADSDSDRVEAKLGQKWLQIDDFRFSPQKCVFQEVFLARSGGLPRVPRGLAGARLTPVEPKLELAQFMIKFGL